MATVQCLPIRPIGVSLALRNGLFLFRVSPNIFISCFMIYICMNPFFVVDGSYGIIFKLNCISLQFLILFYKICFGKTGSHMMHNI